jgi:ElaB/YqjD/DUF883 family membrane-anchored ribosome-binding protein
MVHNSQSQTVTELRRESERARAELSQTVEALKSKITDAATDIRQMVSPAHIKAEVSDFVVEKSRHWLDNLKQQAMDNPMQALAAGSAIAVPAFRMIRSVPLPLLMIGAGLALTSPRVRNAVAATVSSSVKAPHGGDLDDATEAAHETWQSARSQTATTIDEARSAVTRGAAQARDAAAQMADDTRKRVADLGESARETLNSARESVNSTMSSASEATRDALDTTRTTVAETLKATRASAENLVRNNTALVGGLGLAIGALIAASLPSTRTESEALGPASDALRKGAADAASEKFDEMKQTAMSATEQAAEKISESGIGSQMSQATEEATEKLKTVADDAITTAFEPSHTDHREHED